MRRRCLVATQRLGRITIIGASSRLVARSGRARGGWTTKLDLANDGQGRPLSLWLTGDNVNDSTELGAVLAGIHVPRLGPGPPGPRPDRLLGDKGYSSRRNRTLLAARSIKVTIPEKDAQAGHRRRHGSAGGRAQAFWSHDLPATQRG